MAGPRSHPSERLAGAEAVWWAFADAGETQAGRPAYRLASWLT